MIRLTRLNNRPLIVNSDLIKFIENAPDTVITLITGEKLVVLEAAEEVMARIIEYRRRLCGARSLAPRLEVAGEEKGSPEQTEGRGDPEDSSQQEE